MKRPLLAFLLASLCAGIAQAAPLNVVNVSAPAINCVFNPACTITVNDTTANLTLAGGGTGFLQSRTFKALAGAPAAGLAGYQYRIDLRNAVAALARSCVNSLTVNVGPVAALDYNGDGNVTDQVYVVTGGGLGTIGLASAVQSGRNITFTFGSPVCPGSSSGNGDSTFFFGLTSRRPPRSVTARYREGASDHTIQARAPQLPPGKRSRKKQ